MKQANHEDSHVAVRDSGGGCSEHHERRLATAAVHSLKSPEGRKSKVSLLFFLSKDCFGCGPFKVFTELVTILLLVYILVFWSIKFWFFGLEAGGILAP